MCVFCRSIIERLATSPAAIENSWKCTICGEQKFKKDADPEGRLVPIGTDWTWVAFWFALAAVAVAYLLYLANRPHQ